MRRRALREPTINTRTTLDVDYHGWPPVRHNALMQWSYMIPRTLGGRCSDPPTTTPRATTHLVAWRRSTHRPQPHQKARPPWLLRKHEPSDGAATSDHEASVFGESELSDTCHNQQEQLPNNGDADNITTTTTIATTTASSQPQTTPPTSHETTPPGHR